jgi:hypothetical protein
VLVSKLLSKRGHRKQPSSSTTSPLSTPSPLSGESESKGPLSPVETLPDVHPSLVEYLSQFPQSLPLGSEQGVTLPSSIFPEQPLQPHAAASIYQLSAQFAAQHQSPSLPSWQQSPSTFATSRMTIQSFNQDPSTFFDGLQGQSSFTPSGFPPIPPDDSLMDFRMMMSGESGIDEQWVSFMRDSGFLDGSLEESGAV